MTTRIALKAYAERLAIARTRYRQASEQLASLPEFGRVAAEAVAFGTLQSEQQSAIRDLVASEFADLLELRKRLSGQPLREAPHPGHVRINKES